MVGILVVPLLLVGIQVHDKTLFVSRRNLVGPGPGPGHNLNPGKPGVSSNASCLVTVPASGGRATSHGRLRRGPEPDSEPETLRLLPVVLPVSA